MGRWQVAHQLRGAVMPSGAFINGLAPGLSRLAQAIGQQGGAYQSAYDNELQGQSRMAQAISAARANNAKAAQDTAETELLSGRPGQIDEAVALQTGTSLPLINAVRQYARTGQMAMRDLQGPADESGIGPGQAPLVDDSTRSKIAQALARTLPMRTNLKDTNLEDYAKAQGMFREQDLGDQILAGARSAGDVGAAQAALGGKPLYHFDQSGLVGNNFSGALDESSGRARAVTGKETALSRQAAAGAAENYAQAENARAQAEKARSEAATGQRTSHVQVVTDGNGNITLLDKVTGQARPAIGSDGKPMQGKGSSAKLTEDQGKATGWLIQAENAFNNMQAAMAGGSGAEKPGLGDVVGQVPFLGGVGNAITGAKRQQFNQASSSLSEALLRAATGAGVNRDEAIQKVKELTPQIGDGPSVRKQKLDSIPLYLESLKVRAGPGAAPAADVVSNFGPAAAPAAASGGWTYLGKE